MKPRENFNLKEGSLVIDVPYDLREETPSCNPLNAALISYQAWPI